MPTKNKKPIAKEGAEPVQEITDAEAVEVSLVDRPANQEPFLLIKSADGSTSLELPIDAEGILALAKSLGDAGEHLGKLSGIVARAVSTEGATFPASLTTEITKAVELLGEHYKPTEVEKSEEPAEEASTETIISPAAAFTASVQAIREKLWNSAGETVEWGPIVELLKSALASCAAAVAASDPTSVSAMSMAADDLAKCQDQLPDSGPDEIKETSKLLKQLEIAIRPSAAIQKSFDEYRTAAEGREKALNEQNQRLRKALQEAVSLAKGRVTPLSKSQSDEPRPAPQAEVESVLSQTPTQAAQPTPVNWGTDLAAEVEAEERAARGGQ